MRNLAKFFAVSGESTLMAFAQNIVKLLAIGIMGLAASCAATPLALSQYELAIALEESGIDKDVATCAAGLERDSAPTQDLLDANRLAGFIADCRESAAGLEALQQERREITELAFAEPQAYGDDPALDLLWDECEAGSGEACDQLFADSAISSEYEKFGLSCGNRPDVLDCAELDSEIEVQPIPEIAVVQTTVPAENPEEPSDASETETDENAVG